MTEVLQETSPRLFRLYAEYKESAIEGIGDIPAHWNAARTDSLLAFEKVQVEPSTITNELVFHYSIPSVQETGDGRLQPPTEIDSAKLRITGQRLLISKLNPRKGVVLLAAERDVLTLCSTEFVPFIINRCDARWALYLFLSESTRQRLSAVVRSATRSHQRAEIADIVKMWQPVPPEHEQRAIAAFLDRETAKIDALVAKKERLIELLQEKRMGLITEAVTKGLDSTVAMKDSGVEWLGSIPAHWEAVRVKHALVDRISGPFGSSLTKDTYAGSTYRVYGQEQVIPGDFTIGDYYIPESKFQAMKRYAVQAGDVLLSCVGTFGKATVVPEGIEPGIINPRLILLRPERGAIVPAYLELFLKSGLSFAQMEEISRGGTMDIINLSTISALTMPLPPKSEQHELLEIVRIEQARIDSLVSKVRVAIEHLKELRTALISAAVTGKIDVREVPSDNAGARFAAGDTVVMVVPACVTCIHRDTFAATCSAFPMGIPEQILNGTNQHRNPVEGDHGIQWEQA